MSTRIDCVVFDIGNVLIRWDPKNLYRKMGLSDAETDRMIAETGIHDLNIEFDRGMPFAQGCAELASRHPQYSRYLEAWDTRWTEMLDGAIEDNAQLIADVRRTGLPVHAISNFSREKFDVARRMFPFLDTFDELVVSADVGLVKPDRAIFEVLFKRRPIKPEATVFIDDSAANIATAQGLGLHTIHVVDEHVPVRQHLRTLGVGV